MRLSSLLLLLGVGGSISIAPSGVARHATRTHRPPLSMQQLTKPTPPKPTDSTTLEDDLDELPKGKASFSYAEFARQRPFTNNILIATTKTAAADLLAQVVIAQTPIADIDWQRSLLFCLFGATYLGGFQYFYQVNVFKKLFDVDSFTSQPWVDKFRDGPGLRALAAQTALDLTVLTFVYLPTFYIFKAAVFSGSLDPSEWASSGLGSYQAVRILQLKPNTLSYC